jgi:hypothetical protein
MGSCGRFHRAGVGRAGGQRHPGAEYGEPLAVQTVQTQFGDNLSEWNAGYARIDSVGVNASPIAVAATRRSIVVWVARIHVWGPPSRTRSCICMNLTQSSPKGADTHHCTLRSRDA